jgi:hypothetical protein
MVSTDRVLEGSYKSTTYESWHDSIMLYIGEGQIFSSLSFLTFYKGVNLL